MRSIRPVAVVALLAALLAPQLPAAEQVERIYARRRG
jgi:hypothetical protein